MCLLAAQCHGRRLLLRQLAVGVVVGVAANSNDWRNGHRNNDKRSVWNKGKKKQTLGAQAATPEPHRQHGKIGSVKPVGLVGRDSFR